MKYFHASSIYLFCINPSSVLYFYTFVLPPFTKSLPVLCFYIFVLHCTSIHLFCLHSPRVFCIVLLYICFASIHRGSSDLYCTFIHLFCIHLPRVFCIVLLYICSASIHLESSVLYYYTFVLYSFTEGLLYCTFIHLFCIHLPRLFWCFTWL